MTNIGSSAFSGCRGLTSVTIPDGVTSIGSSAFEGCSGLTSVTIASSVTSIWSYAFDGCNNVRDASVPGWKCGIPFNNVTNLIISAGTTSIGEFAFYDCNGLTSITIPSSVTNIVNNAFYRCYNVCDVTVPGWKCGIPFSNVTNLIISVGTTIIKSDAFSSCSGLTSVTIPDSVTSIGDYAFAGCRGLTSVTIPDSVTSIGDRAFSGCSGLESITIPDSVKRIGSFTFSGCSGLASVTIPDSVTCIWDGAFSGCSGLASITIPDGVTSIGSSAFSDCSGLASVTIPDSVTCIGSSAFEGCSGLTSVTIPDSVTSIGMSAFNGCNVALYDATTIPEVKLVDGWMVGYMHPVEVDLSECRGIVEGAAFGGFPEGWVDSAGNHRGEKESCSSLTSVTIGLRMKSIPRNAFYDCKNLQSVTIRDGVTSIGEWAFYNCNGLTSVTIPDSVTSIGEYAFSNCSGLSSVAIPDSVTSIGRSAFYYCSGLTSVTIGNGVTSIGGSAFSGCSGLTSVWVPDSFTGAERVFANCPAQIYYYHVERLTAEDASAADFEHISTNACRVTFEWKCSCEPMRKGRMYDYLAFSIDGVQKEAICGEVDWTNRVYVIEGEGEHVLKWTYTKDESGAEGEDCGWIRRVSVAAPVTLAFLPGGADEGETPASMSFYQDDGTVSLPSQGTLAWPKHTFLGWSDGEKVFKSGADYPCDAEATTLVAAWSRNELSAPVIVAPESFYQGETAPVSITAEHGTAIHYTLDGSEPTAESPRYAGPFVVSETTTVRAIAVRDDYFDSPVASFTTTKDATSYADAVNCPFLDFTPDDGTGWRLVRNESPDGWALKSGVIMHSQTSRVEAVVYGEGIVTFSYKVAGEVVKGDVYDGLAFMIDGVQQGDLVGNADWTTNTFVVAGDGLHTLSWLYVKDESDDEPVAGDCAWIDEVSWASTRAVTVTLDANGGSLGEASGTLRSRANEPIGDLPVPVREGWTFLGWFTGIESGECVLAETVIPNDATLYAHWTRIFLTVTFNANGGTCGTESTSVAYGEAVGALPVPSRDDYVFLGWFTAVEGGERVTADNAIVESMTLYAQWRCLFEGAWAQDADGVWSSGETADNTEKPLTMTVAGAGTVTFRWKVSCEDYFVFKGQQIRQDGLSFLVDGVEKSFINGVTDWASVTVDVDGSGTHTLEWVYVKDESGGENDDCGWVDGVVWTPCGEDGVVVDMGGGKTLTIPTEWISGKTTRTVTDVAANGLKVWQCYVLGLDPEDAESEFKITAFPMKADGTPDLANLAISPDQSKWNVEGARLVIKGKASLNGSEGWQTVTDENKAEMRFFRVEVQLP